MPIEAGTPANGARSSEFRPAAPGSKCPIVLASDENYAMPLATTLRSLAEANERHWPLAVTVLTDGFAEQTRARVLASLPHGSVSLNWSLIDLSRFANLSLIPHISRMTYGRFSIDQVFATDVRRIVYLDSDLLVLGDLGPLFDVDLGDDVLAAVPDEFIDEAIRKGDAGSIEGVPRVARYFNAGVLVINLQSWRSHATSRLAIEYMASFPNSPYSDQDGLNAACDGRWTVLDGRWNHQRHLSERIDALASHERPSVVHFITRRKPWLPRSMSRNAGLYDSYRARTEFRRDLAERIRDATTTFAHRALRKVRAVIGSTAGD